MKSKIILRLRTPFCEAKFLKEKVKQEYESIKSDFIDKSPTVKLKLRESKIDLKLK